MKDGWQTKTLGDVCEFENGDRGENYPSKSIQTTEGVPFINAGHLTDDGINLNNLNYIPQARFDLLGNGKIRNDDILFCLRGSLGKFASVGGLSQGAIASSLVIVRPKETVLNAFMLAYFRSEMCAEMILKYKNGAAQPNLASASLRKFLIPVPPLPEQRRIVGILDEAFEVIASAKANAEKNLQNARDLFESHLGNEHSDRGLLGDLVTIKTGKLDANAAVEGGIYPFFTCSRKIFAIDKYAFDCEAILLAGNNAIGDFNVKHFNGKFNAYQRTYVITVNEKNEILYRFLYFQMLKSLKKFKEQSVGAGTKFLKLGMIKGLEIALPSIAEQQRIVSTMDSIHEETKCLESIYHRKLAALDELKKSLLHRAFNGQL
jgi:type I restriction enzyme S subunit